ncbi:MAG TPA: type I DNA topoisomerase [Spirochaetota bacterium]|nr:type I DNA topoisomerase [Spirochaetota bacterium]HPJ41189.1 type I DNA topoisomerase [Spirochaetota bacterium]HPR38466.1 type I DNA topoisomerase [Spirochaetota bacterium]
MAKNNKPDTLVIVESPSKAKTINKYLGKNYIISSSVGHIIDLPKSRLAIDIEHGFKPEYITIRGKAKILNELKKQASSVSNVLLATDPDREGEAISWHLSNALSVKNSNIKRIEFNEITETAVKEAVAHPREINIDLVNAQQARRILDRIVGYYLSPILWKKVKRGLSAGRVQSAALKVICDREEEIEKFIPQEYWSIDAECSHSGKKFTASLGYYKNEKIKLTSKAEVDTVLNAIAGKKLTVSEIKKQERRRKPPAPYITSRLQQDAANRLGFTSKKTMMVAQQLYEGIDITGAGPMGLITYMRTDSTRISENAIQMARSYISENFKPEYLPETPNIYKAKKSAQDAHEAIRPSDVNRTPDSIKGDLSRDQFRLYDLIWRRFVASQMTAEVTETITINLTSEDYTFRANGNKVLFPGFTEVEKQSKSEKAALPSLKEKELIEVSVINPEQHFTTPPPRYNDASLVKFLEESGIGRPSTYAPTIDTLQKRYYITRSGKQLIPTLLGKIVNNIMSNHFSSLVSVDFTAEMEGKLDRVESSEIDWVKMLEEFYSPFKDLVENAEHNIEEMKGVLDEETDYVCEKCGRKMIKKLGRFGFFLACSGFPECRSAKSLPLGKCPKCDGDVVKRASTGGKGAFYGCSNYPACDFLTREVPSERNCPNCGKLLFVKKIKGRGEELNCLNPDCGFKVELLDDVPAPQEEEQDS